MRALALLLGLALSAPAWAATYYLDPTAANGGSGTEVSPYNEFADVTLSAGDTLLLKSGTTITGESLVITSLANVTVGIYGGTARATIDCNNAVNYGLDLTQDDELRISDIDVKRCLVNNVLVDMSTTGTVDVYLTRVDGSDITAAQGSNFVTGNSFHASTASGALGRLNINYTDVSCSNVTGHCFDQRLEVFSMHVRSECDGAGIGGAYGAHCFTSSPRTQIWTTGWTNSASTIYYRDRVVSTDQEYALCGRGGTVGDFCLSKVASTTSPSTGQWSQTNAGVGACTNVATRGCIYANWGIDPNTTSGNFSETRLARYVNGATYRDVEAQGAVSSGAGAEGDGVVCDDLTANCIIGPGVSSHDNERMGIQLRQTLNAIIDGAVVFNNGENGALTQGSIGASIYNSTINNSGLGVRANTDYEVGLTIKNVVSSNNTKNWIIDPQSAAQVTQSNNAGYNGAQADDSFTPTVTSDPQYAGGTTLNGVDSFCLTSTSPLLAAGTYIGAWAVGYAGQDLGKPPAIGARGLCNTRASSAFRPAASR